MARSLVTIAAALLVSVAVTPAHSQARSTAFERFVFSFFEDSDSAREGLDTEALGRLVGEERRRAGDMLINALPDSRAIIGLGVLRSQRAEPNLLRLFEAKRLAQRNSKLLPDLGWSPYKLLHLVKALSRIRPDPRWPAAAVDVLGSSNDRNERQEAAEALYEARDPATVRALTTALDDPEPLVRYHAARGLLATHGLFAESTDPQHMLYRLMADEPSRREHGKLDVLDALALGPLSR
jgi:hypothetical protein